MAFGLAAPAIAQDSEPARVDRSQDIAWQNARHAGYAADDRLVAVRGGWWTREWRFAEIGKLHAIRWGQTPVDRMLGMARLLLDTAGGNAMAAAFAKLKRYRGEDLAQASVAVRVDATGAWRVAYGSVAPTPIRGPTAIAAA